VPDTLYNTIIVPESAGSVVHSCDFKGGYCLFLVRRLFLYWKGVVRGCEIWLEVPVYLCGMYVIMEFNSYIQCHDEWRCNVWRI